MVRAHIHFDETAALTFDPFDGDTDDGGFGNRIVNEIVTMGEVRTCTVCQGPTHIGTRARHIVDTTLDDIADAESFVDYEKARQEHHVCAACCAAGIKDDDGAAFARRQDLGAARASQKRAAE